MVLGLDRFYLKPLSGQLRYLRITVPAARMRFPTTGESLVIKPIRCYTYVNILRVLFLGFMCSRALQKIKSSAPMEMRLK